MTLILTLYGPAVNGRFTANRPSLTPIDATDPHCADRGDWPLFTAPRNQQESLYFAQSGSGIVVFYEVHTPTERVARSVEAARE